MIVDTSALMAIVLKEPEKDALFAVLAAADRVTMSAANWVEIEVVLIRRGNPLLEAAVAEIVQEFGVAIAPVTATQAQVARSAYREFGKGTGHPAKLNFGDCFAYALAKETGEPLLFKGNDFAHTVVAKVL